MAIRVLLVDDHAMVRDGLRFLLEAHDIEVVGSSGNGRDALRKARELQPEIAVVDIAMPEMNGLEMTHEIHHVSSATRVLILSMHHTIEHIRQALEAGAQGYLLKRSAGAEMVDAIGALHAGGTYFSQEIAATVVRDYTHNARPSSPLDDLSHRERQILQLTVEGRCSAETAKSLCLSPKTVDTYRSRMMQKLGVRDLHGLMKFAIQHGLVSWDSMT